MSKQELQVKEDTIKITPEAKAKMMAYAKEGNVGKILDTLSQFAVDASNGQLTQNLLKQLSQISDSMSLSQTVKDIEAINPQDQVERMLAAQMITTHNMLMECFKRAYRLLENDTVQCINIGHDTVRLADKLARTYAMQMETLSRYRNKGKQKMTVEHVHVNAGGKAIIGNVSSNKENKAE